MKPDTSTGEGRLAAGEREEPVFVCAVCSRPEHDRHADGCGHKHPGNGGSERVLTSQCTLLYRRPAPAVVPSEVVEELERRLAVEDSLETGMDVHDVYSIAADAIAALKGGAKP